MNQRICFVYAVVHFVCCFSISGPLCAEETEEVTPASREISGENEWPRWRGIHFDGISAEADWGSDWPESGPAVLWEANIGIGFSSFSIADGRLYTMGSVEDAEAPNVIANTNAEATEGEADKTKSIPRKDVIWCFNATTGKMLWKRDYPAKLIDILHEGGPAATPTLYDELGYTVSKEGHFVCFDTTSGKPLWTKELVADLDVEMPVWGFSGSALIWEDLVILEAGKTAAFNRKTGELVWQTEKFRAGYSSPVTFSHPETNETLVASLNNDVLLVLRAKDGSEVARAPFVTAHPTNACTPIIQDDTIFLSSGYNRGCTLFRLIENQLEVVYDNRNMRNHMNSCVFHNGFLYGFDGNSHTRRNAMLKCIDYASGEIQWKKRGYGVGSLLLAGDRIIALSDEGELLALKATSEKFDLLANAKIIEGKCWTLPVLCNGKLYVRNAPGRLICLDLAN